MNTVVFIIACVAGVVATLFCAYKLGRRVETGRQAQTVAKAQQKINEVADSDLPATAKRLRSGDF